MKRPTPPLELALDRLMNPSNSAMTRARAQRLGAAVGQHIELANTKPQMQRAGIDRGSEHVASGPELKVSKFVGAWLCFVVGAEFNYLETTPDWLRHTERVDLVLNKYGAELPDRVERNIADPTSVVTVRLAPAQEYETDDHGPGNQPYAASYEGGSRLDAPNTEKVISILALMARDFK